MSNERLILLCALAWIGLVLAAVALDYLANPVKRRFVPQRRAQPRGVLSRWRHRRRMQDTRVRAILLEHYDTPTLGWRHLLVRPKVTARAGRGARTWPDTGGVFGGEWEGEDRDADDWDGEDHHGEVPVGDEAEPGWEPLAAGERDRIVNGSGPRTAWRLGEAVAGVPSVNGADLDAAVDDVLAEIDQLPTDDRAIDAVADADDLAWVDDIDDIEDLDDGGVDGGPGEEVPGEEAEPAADGQLPATVVTAALEPTIHGTEPSQATLRRRFWSQLAEHAAAADYGAANVMRMKRGTAPQRFNPISAQVESLRLSRSDDALSAAWPDRLVDPFADANGHDGGARGE